MNPALQNETTERLIVNIKMARKLLQGNRSVIKCLCVASALWLATRLHYLDQE
ncbi:hypothetical protein [Pseudomonas viridiflava]|uniref:hypothetical protein n=1 Tax=Pseudomonas viridiflava TaxID=33069 RepID=UPI0013CE72F1|nr:hypothetical protein [Pseudomonas viridiflava]MBI6576965.1 hypothetical protein [Pseudomonas viridiflava]MBI6607492.1 hypothetical protein [Pseudomonas viridiflava]MBI6638848.1 hypothetical protein [Pseudomonas viridiflava]MBI6869536.1 hypothetical protein [Pseudomonas viridiflava]MEE4133529.1 hypothetical protein [Pseudomonas viridiflava]